MSSVKSYRKNARLPAVLFAKAEWCPHCQDAKPELEEAASMLGSVLPVYAVDSERNADTIRKLKVQAFPTIMYQSAEGKVVEYKGERKGKKIGDWACAQSGMCGR